MSTISMMVPYKTLTASKKGRRGLAMTIPREWAKEVGIEPGDRVQVFRDPQHLDRLIVKPFRARKNGNGGEA